MLLRRLKDRLYFFYVSRPRDIDEGLMLMSEVDFSLKGRGREFVCLKRTIEYNKIIKSVYFAQEVQEEDMITLLPTEKEQSAHSCSTSKFILFVVVVLLLLFVSHSNT